MQIKEPSLLYAPYESIITNNGKCFKANLYSINMSNFIQYGFIHILPNTSSFQPRGLPHAWKAASCIGY